MLTNIKEVILKILNKTQNIDEKINIEKDIVFKNATLNDLSYIKKLFKEGVEEGHYKKRLIENSKNFDETIRAYIWGVHDVLRNAKPYTWIIYHKKDKIGFIIMSYHIHTEEIEFHYLSLEKKFQNKSLGTKVVKQMETDFFILSKEKINYQSKIFISRCNQEKSKQMIRVFIKNGYKIDKYNDLEKGWAYLIKDTSLKIFNYS